MCRSEIFATILQIVSQETGIPPEQILSRKKDEKTVDARYLLVYILKRNGFCSSRISSCIRKDIRTVNLILTRFEARKSSRKYFGILLDNIKKQLGNRGFSS